MLSKIAELPPLIRSSKKNTITHFINMSTEMDYDNYFKNDLEFKSLLKDGLLIGNFFYYKIEG